MNKYKSDIFRSVHEDAEALYEVGAFDARRMHEFDVQCLVPSAVPNRDTSPNKGDVSQNSEALSRPRVAVAAARA